MNFLKIYDAKEETDPLLRVIKKYKTHLSILQVKNSFKDAKVLSFKDFNVEDVKRDIDNIDNKKATPKNDIPVKITNCNSNKTHFYLNRMPKIDSCYNLTPV